MERAIADKEFIWQFIVKTAYLLKYYCAKHVFRGTPIKEGKATSLMQQLGK